MRRLARGAKDRNAQMKDAAPSTNAVPERQTYGKRLGAAVSAVSTAAIKGPEMPAANVFSMQADIAKIPDQTAGAVATAGGWKKNYAAGVKDAGEKVSKYTGETIGGNLTNVGKGVQTQFEKNETKDFNTALAAHVKTSSPGRSVLPEPNAPRTLFHESNDQSSSESSRHSMNEQDRRDAAAALEEHMNDQKPKAEDEDIHVPWSPVWGVRPVHHGMTPINRPG